MDPGKDNEEKSQDPGAARFGNFINYYSFNPPENIPTLHFRPLHHEHERKDQPRTIDNSFLPHIVHRFLPVHTYLALQCEEVYTISIMYFYLL